MLLLKVKREDFETALAALNTVLGLVRRNGTFIMSRENMDLQLVPTDEDVGELVIFNLTFHWSELMVQIRKVVKDKTPQEAIRFFEDVAWIYLPGVVDVIQVRCSDAE